MDSQRSDVADRPGYGRVGGVDNPVARAEYGDDAAAVRDAARNAAGDIEDVAQHARIYELSDSDADRPRELRGDPEGTTLSVVDLVEHYEFQGAEDVVDLADLWERWNRGIGQESETFIEAETRSLSVGDVVVLDGDAYRCDRIGWTPIELREGSDTVA